MGNELVVRQAGFVISADDFETMQRMAKAMVASNYFSDVKDIAQAVVKIQAGSEIGIPPFAAITGIHIIKNKPVLGANMIATLVKNSGRYDYRVKQLDDEAAVITFYENGEKVGESSFTIDDAKSAGLMSSSTWKSYPRNMLFARAISNGARWYAPGIFGGSTLYTPNELGADEDEDGAIINVAQSVGAVATKHHGHEAWDGSPIDPDTGEITEQPEAETAEWDELEPASETPATNGDARGASSPKEQAQREDKRPSRKAAKAQPAQTNGDKKWPARPWDAETLKEYAAYKVDGYSAKVKNHEGQAKYAVSSLEKVTSDSTQRRSVTLYLFGVESSEDLSEAQRAFAIDWVGATSDNEYTPSDVAIEEAKRVVKAWLVQQGQGELL